MPITPTERFVPATMSVSSTSTGTAVTAWMCTSCGVLVANRSIHSTVHTPVDDEQGLLWRVLDRMFGWIR